MQRKAKIRLKTNFTSKKTDKTIDISMTVTFETDFN